MCNPQRSNKMACIAFEQAKLSPCRYKHGSVISKGSKVISKGFNNHRTKYSNSLCACTHAEIDVANKFIKTYMRKKNSFNKKNFNNFILWVVRLSNPNSNKLESKITGSKPCKECIKKLTKLGFCKVGYSDNNGNIIIENIKYMNNDHLSEAQLSFKKLEKSV